MTDKYLRWVTRESIWNAIACTGFKSTIYFLTHDGYKEDQAYRVVRKIHDKDFLYIMRTRDNSIYRH